jgi:D-alanyl-D-alanine carboxypeptidase
VKDLLYGMMLPSGNDASMALAEHFGKKLPSSLGALPHRRFIRLMNDRYY